MLLNSTVFYVCERNQAARLRRPDSDGVFLSWKCAFSDRKNTALNRSRLVFSAQHNDVGNVKVRPTLGKEGETVSGSPSSWIPWQGAMDYACAPPGRKTRLKRTISNTRTIRSGRFLTAPSIRWSRLYMSAHSYAGYAVTFHCILINTWLNEARTTLLITQDKKNTTQPLCTRPDCL